MMQAKLTMVVGIVSVLFFASCGGAGGGGIVIDTLEVGSIDGPGTVGELETTSFSVCVSGDTGIIYQWLCSPQSAGQFNNPTSSTTEFTATEVAGDLIVEIKVVVTSDQYGPVERKKNITILDSPILEVSGIQGSSSLYELTGTNYSVTATGDSGIMYLWYCLPLDAGQFTNFLSATTTFNAQEVIADVEVKIKVSVTSDHCSPIERIKNVTIMNVVVPDEIDVETFLLLYPNAYLKSPDGQFLGKVNANAFDTDSIANKYGTYGSEYSSLSIWNTYGTYGSPYSSYSPWNPYASYPPILYDGYLAIGYLTLNTTFTPRMNPQDLYDYLDMD